MTPTTNSRPMSAWPLYIFLLALLTILTAGGYVVFRVFASQVTPELRAYNLLTLSIIAGIASFFSPCAFPLLPGYLSLYYSSIEQASDTADSRWSAIALGLAAAGGVISFSLVLGGIIGLVGAGVTQGLSIIGATPNFTRLIRGFVGVILIGLGIAQLRGVNLKPILAEAFAWETRPRRSDGRSGAVRRLYIYGLGYNAAGMGCTGPILAGLVIVAFSSGGLGPALGAFAVFAATMGVLMLLVSFLVSASLQTLIQRLKAAAPHIKTVSAVLLVAVGAFNIVTSLDTASFIRLLFP